VDFVSAPAGVLLSHSADKRADLVSDSGPTAARARSPSPVEEKTSPLPADNSLGLYNYQRVGAAGPDTA
jgi:hypothetical protein